jgi:hypothetical protein
MYPSFHEELEKLGKEEAKKPSAVPLFSAPVLAHELGHASRQEERKYPGLRRALETGIQLGGFGGMIAGIATGRPLLAASMAGIGKLPVLVEEAGATIRGLKALKESGKYTPEELVKARNVLLHAGATYLGGALGRAGGAALGAALVKGNLSKSLDPDAARAVVGGAIAAPWIAPMIGASLAGIGLIKHIDKGPTLKSDRAEQLRKQMAVAAILNRLKDKHKEEAGFYMPPDPDALHILTPRKSIESALQSITHGESKAKIKKSLDIGGVFVPSIKKTKSKTAAAKKEKKPEQKSFGRRLGKKLGLGAVSLGVAAPIVAAAIGKKGRGKVVDALKRAVSKSSPATGRIPIDELEGAGYQVFRPQAFNPHRMNIKKSSADTLPHEKLSEAQHWASVAAALVE